MNYRTIEYRKTSNQVLLMDDSQPTMPKKTKKEQKMVGTMFASKQNNRYSNSI